MWIKCQTPKDEKAKQIPVKQIHKNIIAHIASMIFHHIWIWEFKIQSKFIFYTFQMSKNPKFWQFFLKRQEAKAPHLPSVYSLSEVSTKTCIYKSSVHQKPLHKALQPCRVLEVFTRFPAPPQNNGGEWITVYEAQNFVKGNSIYIHFIDSRSF